MSARRLARDLNRLGGVIFAGLPIAGTDTGDYLVRNLVGIDPARGLVAIGDLVENGKPDHVLPPRHGERDRRHDAHAREHAAGAVHTSRAAAFIIPASAAAPTCSGPIPKSCR